MYRTVFSGIVLQLTGVDSHRPLVQVTNANITKLRGNPKSPTLFGPPASVLRLTGEAFRYLLVQVIHANIDNLRGNPKCRTLFWPLLQDIAAHW